MSVPLSIDCVLTVTGVTPTFMKGKLISVSSEHRPNESLKVQNRFERVGKRVLVKGGEGTSGSLIY